METPIDDDALVVRGGRNQPTDIERGTGVHPSGVTGISVECASGLTLVMMPATKVYADFQNADPQGRLRLNCAGTLRDLSRQHIVLRNGLQLLLYCDDLTDAGEPNELRVLGEVEYSTQEQLWVARIDWAAISHAFSSAEDSKTGDGGKTRVG